MSLRSRLDFEVSYALNTLLILSAGVGAAPSFQFGLGACEDLLEELLDVLEENSFRGDAAEGNSVAATQSLDQLLFEDVGASTSRPSKRARRHGGIDALPTYRDWIAAAAEEEAELQIWRRRRSTRSRSTAGSVLNGVAGSEVESHASSSALSSYDAPDGTISTNGVLSENERSSEKKAVTALTILTILKNFSTMPENLFFFNNTPRLLVFWLRCVRAMHTASGHPPKMMTNKSMLQSLTLAARRCSRRSKHFGYAKNRLSSSPTSRAKRFLCAIKRHRRYGRSSTCLPRSSSKLEPSKKWTMLLEIAELAASLPPGAPAPPVIRRTPYHADLALDALSKLALPDENRQVLGDLVDGPDLERLVTEIIRMLPMTAADFKVLNTEHRLGYCERLSMCLYNLAFLSPPTTKLALRRIPGLSGIILRIVKKLARATPEFSRNPFSVLCRRLVEALRLISDGQDMFGAPRTVRVWFLGCDRVGRREWRVGKKQVGLLLSEEEGVVEIWYE